MASKQAVLVLVALAWPPQALCGSIPIIDLGRLWDRGLKDSGAVVAASQREGKGKLARVQLGAERTDRPDELYTALWI